MPCSYTIASRTQTDVKITTKLSFDPNSDGSGVWNELKINGEFTKSTKSASQIFGEMACGMAAKIDLPENAEKQIDMVLVWDMPSIYFSDKQKTYHRFYTKYFGSESASLKIAAYALDNYNSWEENIDKWQKKILCNR